MDTILDEKKIRNRIYNQRYVEKKKEKKRLMIEQIKKERAENSLLFSADLTKVKV